MDKANRCVIVTKPQSSPSEPPKVYYFDNVFAEDSTQVRFTSQHSFQRLFAFIDLFLTLLRRCRRHSCWNSWVLVDFWYVGGRAVSSAWTNTMSFAVQLANTNLLVDFRKRIEAFKCLRGITQMLVEKRLFGDFLNLIATLDCQVVYRVDLVISQRHIWRQHHLSFPPSQSSASCHQVALPQSLQYCKAINSKSLCIANGPQMNFKNHKYFP